MGAFADWAQNYYDIGLSVLPVDPKTKSCLVPKWSELFCKNFPDQKMQAKLVKKYHKEDIGLAMGRSTGLVGIDFDYEMPDAKAIEALVLGVLPRAVIIKKGQKGWTRFYKFDESIKNKSINRFGSRMIDVLSTGRLTVLPPSQHKAGMKYHWLSYTNMLDAEPGDYKPITALDISRLEEIASTDNDIFNDVLTKNSVRHDTIVGWILKESDYVDNLEDLVQNILTYDLETHKKHKKGPYFKDSKYLGDKRPYDVCKDLANRVVGWKINKKKDKGVIWELGKYPKLGNKDGKKSAVLYDDFKPFFDFNLSTARRCKLTDKVYYKDKMLGKWRPVENIIPAIESEAVDAGLSPSYVTRHICKWQASQEPTLLIDIPIWDGKDRVSEIFTKMHIKNLAPKVALDLFKEWCGKVFSRLDSPMNQNRFLILRGKQGIGKDRIINHMFRSFDDYFSEISVEEKKAENYQNIETLIVANIPEFDETRKATLSTLKNMISSPGAKYRAPYARAAEFRSFHVSYISSVNFQNILRDPSGNRRFMIFDVEKIDWSYDNIDSRQLLAQYHHLNKSKYTASESSLNELKRVIVEETPDDVDELIESEIIKIVGDASGGAAEGRVRWFHIQKNTSEVLSRFRISMRHLQQVMKKIGLTHRDNKGVYFKITEKTAKSDGSVTEL